MQILQLVLATEDCQQMDVSMYNLSFSLVGGALQNNVRLIIGLFGQPDYVIVLDYMLQFLLVGH